MKIKSPKLSAVDEFGRRSLTMKCEVSNTLPTPMRFVEWSCVAFGEDGTVLAAEEGGTACNVAPGKCEVVQPDLWIPSGLIGEVVTIEMTADLHEGEEVEVGSVEIPSEHLKRATISSDFTIGGVRQTHPLMLNVGEPDESEEDKSLLMVSGCLVGLEAADFRHIGTEIEVRHGKKVVACAGGTKTVNGSGPIGVIDGLWELPEEFAGRTCVVRLVGYRRAASASARAQCKA